MNEPSKSTKPGVDRRSFLRKLVLGAFGFAVLPPAETYQRVWRATRQPVFWNQTSRSFLCIDETYLCVMEKSIQGEEIMRWMFPAPQISIIENFSLET